MTQTYRAKLPPDTVLELYREKFTTVRLLQIIRERSDKPPFRMAYNCALRVIEERREEMG